MSLLHGMSSSCWLAKPFLFFRTHSGVICPKGPSLSWAAEHCRSSEPLDSLLFTLYFLGSEMVTKLYLIILTRPVKVKTPWGRDSACSPCHTIEHRTGTQQIFCKDKRLYIYVFFSFFPLLFEVKTFVLDSNIPSLLPGYDPQTTSCSLYLVIIEPKAAISPP